MPFKGHVVSCNANHYGLSFVIGEIATLDCCGLLIATVFP
jgi:hypothetical protein